MFGRAFHFSPPLHGLKARTVNAIHLPKIPTRSISTSSFGPFRLSPILREAPKQELAPKEPKAKKEPLKNFPNNSPGTSEIIPEFFNKSGFKIVGRDFDGNQKWLKWGKWEYQTGHEVKIVPPRYGMTVELFLKKIGKECSQHLDKFPNWEALMTSSLVDLRGLGIPIRQRKWIYRWVHKYKLGLEPSHIPCKSIARRNLQVREMQRKKHQEILQGVMKKRAQERNARRNERKEQMAKWMEEHKRIYGDAVPLFVTPQIKKTEQQKLEKKPKVVDQIHQILRSKHATAKKPERTHWQRAKLMKKYRRHNRNILKKKRKQQWGFKIWS